MKEKIFKSICYSIYPFKSGFMFLGLFLFSLGSLFSQSTAVSGGGQGGDPQPGSDATTEYLDVLGQVDFVEFDEALAILAKAIADLRSSLQNIQSPSSSVLRNANIKSDYWRILMNLIQEAESDPDTNMSSVMTSSVVNLHNVFINHQAEVMPNALKLFEETIDMLKK